MPGGFIAIFIAFGAIAVVAAVLSAKARKERQLALRAWAAANGWHYTPEQVSSIEHRFPGFGCLTQGDNRYGYNVVRGAHNDSEIWAFDYHYQTYSTDSKGHRTTHHHRFSALLVDSGLRLAPLSIRQESFLDRMKGVFGFDDIDFESAEFSEKFWVTAANKRWAYDVINQRNMELLLGSPRFALQFDGSHVLAWRNNTFKPVEYEQALTLVFELLAGIPRDIRERLAR
jgi:hypothetical protein